MRECPLELPKPLPILYNDPMNETKSYMTGSVTSQKTGKVYTFATVRQTRTDYAEFMNPASKYERVYYQVNVYVEGKHLNFGFVDDDTDAVAVHKAVQGVIEWDETPNEVLQSMHSRYD